jgi:hypothetical protein
VPVERSVFAYPQPKIKLYLKLPNPVYGIPYTENRLRLQHHLIGRLGYRFLDRIFKQSPV